MSRLGGNSLRGRALASSKRSSAWVVDDWELEHTPNKRPAKKRSESVSSDILTPAISSLEGSGSNGITNVKKLLATGLLEGTRVIYRNQHKKVPGIINGLCYLCSCSRCNFSELISAVEFEKHAGCKTYNQTNHIFLDNGKSLYRIVQDLQNTPSESLEAHILALISGPLAKPATRPTPMVSTQKNSRVCVPERQKKDRIKMDSNVSKSVVPQRSIIVQDLHNNHIPARISGPLVKPASRPTPSMFKQNYYMAQDTSKEQNYFPKWPKKSLKMDSSVSKSITGQKSITGRKKRDNGLHQLIFMPNGLPDGAELAYYASGKRLLDGYKQGDGIFCSCCQQKISPSVFEAHAGCDTMRQPYRYIFTSDGISLHKLAVSLKHSQRAVPVQTTFDLNSQ